MKPRASKSSNELLDDKAQNQTTFVEVEKKEFW